ncbi:NAD(P)-binding domain-containing protein [Micromonospora sp. WMMD882]|uniref:NAD(P)-binding domain-containing protein n=1 Tax=Micromonospora sp. WMMD882 TaxID=3015151 RepID=UPI00248C3A33|nr:NAD(P)-binding domain-containing protein [Micromonospora sp. WMMD882]WBB80806.1 NAD(P)-binding domain-containing protein [Micromonospora sp. WMMD882]
MPDHPHPTRRHRYLIIGAGPSGLQLSYYLQQTGSDYLTIERAPAPAEFFRHFPRHRRLISLNKTHTTSDDPEIKLRWDWNSLLHEPADLPFPHYSHDYFPHADDMVRYLTDFHHHHKLNIQFDTPAHHIDRTPHGFTVHTDHHTIHAQCLIVATGWGHPHIPDIPGIEHATGYETMSTDPTHYTNHRVLILGKGNSAFETASALLGHAAMIHLASPRPLRLAWNTKHPGDVRGHHGAVLDSYQFKTLHSVLDCVIDDIRPLDNRYQVHLTYTHADNETAVMEYDTVLRCTGFTMDTTPFTPHTRPHLAPNRRMPATTPDWQSTNIDGLYFAGTIAQDHDFKRASSAFIDGFRYNLRTLTHLLRERYDNQPLPHTHHQPDPDTLTTLILDRVNWSSALWTQFEYLSDAIVIDPDKPARHYQDLPENHIRQRFQHHPYYYTISLRWGRDPHPDVFHIRRHPQPDRAAESAFIHPVIRRYHGPNLTDELHLLEDLLAEWRRPDRHITPLHTWLTTHLT